MSITFISSVLNNFATDTYVNVPQKRPENCNLIQKTIFDSLLEYD